MIRNRKARLALAAIQLPEAALGSFAILLGAFVAVTAWSYQDGSTYDTLGPSLFPLVIGVGLILSGVPILLGALDRRAMAAAVYEEVDWRAVAPVVGSLLLAIALITVLGWVPVIAVVFALVARAFGSRRPLLDLGLGLLFGSATFAIFNYGLGLQLPAGWIVARLVG